MFEYRLGIVRVMNCGKGGMEISKVFIKKFLSLVIKKKKSFEVVLYVGVIRIFIFFMKIFLLKYRSGNFLNLK